MDVMSGMVNIIETLKAKKNFITIFLALAGIAVIGLYIHCDTGCRYLQGSIFGIDLKVIGVGYMLAIAILAAFRQSGYVRALLAGGIGAELYLIAFQVAQGVFCPFCMTFAVIVTLAFILNYEKPFTVGKGSLKKFAYAFGDVELFPLRGVRIPLLLFVFVGYLFVILTFSGSTTPAFAAEQSLVPSYGSGSYELIVFTDYFCPPCQGLEAEMDPALNEILSKGGVKVTFADVPLHKETPLFVKFFLYIAKPTQNYKKILNARKVLFTLAKDKSITDDESLSKALAAQGIVFKPHDVQDIYPQLNELFQKYKVHLTPSCVVKYSDTDIRTYTGVPEVKNGLALLKAALNSSSTKTKK
jgi:uncharacterized membrane protein/protein-disulfide isomerase